MTDGTRILTTHTGSLPRPEQLVSLLQAQHEGRPFDREELARGSQAAVAACVAKQVECGVDIVSGSDAIVCGEFAERYGVGDRYEIECGGGDDFAAAGYGARSAGGDADGIGDVR